MRDDEVAVIEERHGGRTVERVRRVPEVAGADGHEQGPVRVELLDLMPVTVDYPEEAFGINVQRMGRLDESRIGGWSPHAEERPAPVEHPDLVGPSRGHAGEAPPLKRIDDVLGIDGHAGDVGKLHPGR